MSIIDAWKTCVLTKYASFTGRARRSEFWGFVVVNAAVYVLLLLLFLVLDSSAVVLVLYAAYALAMLVPSLAAAVRRLHDTNKSGWLLLIALVPIVGGLVLLFSYVSDSDEKTNDYGPSPKYGRA
jgi:uncharacterized membrane protein YhaH (DUF805 family)